MSADRSRDLLVPIVPAHTRMNPGDADENVGRIGCARGQEQLSRFNGREEDGGRRQTRHLDDPRRGMTWVDDSSCGTHRQRQRDLGQQVAKGTQVRARAVAGER